MVEIVDTREKIEAFMPLVDHAIAEGLATLEKVEVRFYRSGPRGTSLTCPHAAAPRSSGGLRRAEAAPQEHVVGDLHGRADHERHHAARSPS